MTERLLRCAEVRALVGLATSTIYRKMAAGQFPRPVDLGGAVRWRLSEIEEWQAALDRRDYRSAA